ncbi:TonB-dependent receptor [Pseudomonas cichorii]|uniref:TonB-dependent receptor n=1 Tax=Pseudomonas cichorii TaxID=36746 RepID=UPI001C8B08CF|nr:TonB-dependent receptor [Pseudomonas cichorii]MBX8493740.1 TonB-dependent receptor [Pseudomonas cichorii]MBX8513257.1 TonB-dependent receptor [Pseudomonas cichorii]MBX8574113.1 TonB-dependent receptor [Pseudomonas cichorii]
MAKPTLRYSISPLLLSLPLSAFAASDPLPEERLPSVTVTAEHRQENLQKTPLAISAFDENTLRDQQINNIRDLSGRVPNLTLSRQSISYSAQTYGIRGIGETDPIQEAAVAVYADDLYIPRAISSMLDFNDVERVEVLRGPQGTLYGRNSAAGAIRVITRDPTQETRGFVELGAGTYNAQSSRLLISGPLVDNTLFGSFSALRLSRDGTVRNRTRDTDVNNVDIQSYRGKLRLAPLDSPWDTQLTLAGTFDRGDTTSYTPFDPATGRFDKFKTYSSLDPKNRLDQGSAVLRSIYTFDDHLNFKSVTGWSAFDQPVDYDNSGEANSGNAAPVQNNLIHYKQRYATQEFQLNGDYERFNYTLGVYLYKERFRAERDSLTYSVAADRVNASGQYSTTDTESYALYGQGNYKLTPRLSLTAGLRYTKEHKNFDYKNYRITTERDITGLNFSAETSDSWASVSPKVGLEYAWSDSLTQYGYVAKGFKAGGFDNRAPTLAAAQQGFEPENVITYETGFKGDYLGGRLRSNVAVFYNDYRDLQTNAWDPAISANLRTNVGSAHSYGIELENTALLNRDLTLTANLGYLKAQYDDFKNAAGAGVDADGNWMVFAPRWNASLGLNWTVPVNVPGALVAGTDWQFQTKSYANAVNGDIYEVPQQSFWNANTSYSSGDGHWTTTLAVKNLLNRAYPQSIAYSAASSTAYYAVNDPRTLTLSVRYDL